MNEKLIQIIELQTKMIETVFSLCKESDVDYFDELLTLSEIKNLTDELKGEL